MLTDHCDRAMLGGRDRVESAFEQNQRPGPDLFLQKQAAQESRIDEKNAGTIPVIFQKIPCLQGIWRAPSEMGGFDAIRVGLAADRSRVRDAGWLQIGCICSQTRRPEGLT